MIAGIVVFHRRLVSVFFVVPGDIFSMREFRFRSYSFSRGEKHGARLAENRVLTGQVDDFSKVISSKNKKIVTFLVNVVKLKVRYTICTYFLIKL